MIVMFICYHIIVLPYFNNKYHEHFQQSTERNQLHQMTELNHQTPLLNSAERPE